MTIPLQFRVSGVAFIDEGFHSNAVRLCQVGVRCNSMFHFVGF
jgi:hypothetical protein